METTVRSLEDSPRLAERAFMTDLKTSSDGSIRLTEMYNNLQTELGSLNSKIDLTLKKHEEDYLKAFRYQINALVKQIKEFKSRAQENENKLRRDERIKQLETSLEWYKEEAVKLAESAKHFKIDADKWKAKALALEDDRKFLEKTLKEAKKQLKAQKVEIRKDSSIVISVAEELPKTEIDFTPSTNDGIALVELYDKNPPPSWEFFSTIENFIQGIRNKYEAIIARLKNNIGLRDRKYRAATSHNASLFTEKSDMEALFLECVEEVRKEVIRRRSYSIGRQKYSIQGKQQYKFKQQFTPSDKRKILELLISNEQVLILLYEKLFPYRSSTYAVRQREETKDQGEELPAIDNLLAQLSNKQRPSFGK